MIGEVRFFVCGIPAPKGSMRAFVSRGSRRVVMVHDNVRTKPWSEAVGWAARAAICVSPSKKPMGVWLDFTMPRPASHSTSTGKLRKGAPQWPVAKRDLDKLVRAVLDALTGIAWVDDGQVVRVHAAKHYQDSANPLLASVGCLVRLVELHEEGSA